jgi:FkbM family methyltransferase
MVEPQSAKEAHLVAVSQDLPNVQFRQALLAGEAGRSVTFYEMETGSSVYPENSNAMRREASLTTTTLDLVAAKLEAEEIFLKIDVQGAEIDVLIGAKATLARTVAVQLEVPSIQYNKGAPSFFDVLRFMHERGFAPVEISNETRLKGVLVQADLVFIQKFSQMLHKPLEF